MAGRKYSVVVAHNDYNFIYSFLDALEKAGAEVKKEKGIRHISAWKREGKQVPEGNLGKLVRVSDNLDIRAMYNKRRAAKYVSKHPRSIDLVVINCTNLLYRPGDMDGFKAASYMRKRYYKNRIAIQSFLVEDKDRLRAKSVGVNEMFFEDSDMDGFFGYIVKRYRYNNKRSHG